jgi:dihydroxy-acid dehydratase
MLNGWMAGERMGSGTIVWKARERHAAGDIDYQQFIDIVRTRRPLERPLQHHGHGLDDELAGRGARHEPARLQARSRRPTANAGQASYDTGKRIVEMVWEDLRPSDILTREAFENAIVACSAIGGSTNAPIHLNAIARHVGVELSCDDWERLGFDIPLLVNLQPAGEYLGEEYPPRRRPAGGDGRADRGRQDPRGGADRQRPRRRELSRRVHLGPRRDPRLRQPLLERRASSTSRATCSIRPS